MSVGAITGQRLLHWFKEVQVQYPLVQQHMLVTVHVGGWLGAQETWHLAPALPLIY